MLTKESDTVFQVINVEKIPTSQDADTETEEGLSKAWFETVCSTGWRNGSSTLTKPASVAYTRSATKSSVIKNIFDAFDKPKPETAVLALLDF